MTKKIIIGGVVAGLATFMWGAISHMVLGLGEIGIKQFSNEAPLLAALQANIKEPGFYFFPGMDQSPNQSKEQKAASMKAWNDKYLAGPRGILVYHRDGEQPMSPKQFLVQLGAQIGIAIIAAIVLAQATSLSCYFGRVSLVFLLGLLPFFTIGVPYWNWYGFPTAFTLAELADRLISFLVAGLVLAAMVKPANISPTEPSPALTAAVPQA